MNKDNSLTDYVARFIVATRSTDIPDDVMHLGKRSILDGLGLALAGNAAESGHIVRTSRTEDYGFKISEFPHLIVNQARVLDYFAEFMANSPTRMAPDYGYEFRGLTAGTKYNLVVTTPNYPPFKTSATLGLARASSM